MARLEFAILQHLEGQLRIVLQRDEHQLLERLQIRVREYLTKFESYGKKAEIGDIEIAIAQAFHGLIKEFKDETIRIV